MTLMLFNVHIIQGIDLSIPTNWDHMTSQIFIISLPDDWWIKNVWREYFVQILSFCWDFNIIFEESLVMEMSVLQCRYFVPSICISVILGCTSTCIFKMFIYMCHHSHALATYCKWVGVCLMIPCTLFCVNKSALLQTKVMSARNTNTSWILWKSQKDSPHCRNLENQW